MIKTIAGITFALGFAAAPALAADNSTTIQPSTQSSHPGVKGDVGGKNGPSAKPSNNANDSSGSGSSAGSTGSGNIDPATQPSQDSTGVKGDPGGKNGPAAEPGK